MKTLKALNISNNRCGDTGAIHISRALFDNTVNRIVDLSENQIGNEGAQHLVEALKNDRVRHIFHLSIILI